MTSGCYLNKNIKSCSFVCWLLLLLHFNVASCVLLKMDFGDCTASCGCTNNTETKYDVLWVNINQYII